MDSQPTELEEASEPLSDTVDESFLVGETEVVFREEKEDIPMSDITPKPQPGAKVGSDFWDNDDEWVATAIGETPEGKIVQVRKREGGAGYELCFRTGGTLPPIYSGWYTSFDKAKNAAAEYLATLSEKSA